MATHRKTIPLSRNEDQLLRQLYLHFRIPSDQYPKRPADLAAFVQAWNDLTGRNDLPDDIKHYIVTKRKCGCWVTFDGDYEHMSGPPTEILSPAEWNHLGEIYAELFIAQDIGSDQMMYNPELRARLAAEFFHRTGRRVRGELLHSLIEAKRKRGLWLAAKRGGAFRDIDEVG